MRERDELSPFGLPMRVGRYQLTEPLGVGGMAEVYKATSTGPGGFERTVVIKRILPASSADPTFVRMFVAEAKILGMLNHPNVVQAYDFGEADGTLFLVLEYADGPSLFRAMQALRFMGRVMPVVIAAHFAHEICRALDYVHRLQRQRRRADACRAPRRHAVQRRADVGGRAQAARLRRRALQRDGGVLRARRDPRQGGLSGARGAARRSHRRARRHLRARRGVARDADAEGSLREREQPRHAAQGAGDGDPTPVGGARRRPRRSSTRS